jgi:hypothetical protein
MPNTRDKLRQLYARLTQLDEERARIWSELSDCMSELSLEPVHSPAAPKAATQSSVPRRPARIRSLRDAVLDLMNASPERTFGVYQLATHFGIDRHGEKNLRGLLARMKKDGDIRRVAHGWYQAH